MTSGATPDGWSAYDAAVPHVAGLPELRARMDELRLRRHGPGSARLADVREVVVVVSSSRGGSSLFGLLLRRIPGMLHLRAEINPFFALAGLYSGAERRRVLEAELLADIGHPAPSRHRPAGDDRLVLDIAWRLLVQWPEIGAIPLAELLGRVERVVHREGAAGDAPVHPHVVQLRVVAELRATHPEVHPAYYDIGEDLVEGAFPGLGRPKGPPAPAVVEMPPYVVLDAWQPATADELRTHPLVLTTPRNAFRLEFLADLFPSARLRVIHLTRNPAAAINGLIDGWLHHGFFNCTVPVPLRMPGYSDVVPGGDRWWCYDLPVGWADWVEAPLAQVCGFQWTATHAAILDHLARHRPESVQLRFESLVGTGEERTDFSVRLADWLDVNRTAVLEAVGGDLPVVMATAPPRTRRWLSREAQLRPVLGGETVEEMAATLGYGAESDWT